MRLLLEGRHKLQVLLIGQRDGMGLRWHYNLLVVRWQRATIATDARCRRNWLIVIGAGSAAPLSTTTIFGWFESWMIGLHVLFEGILLSKSLVAHCAVVHFNACWSGRRLNGFEICGKYLNV